MAARPFDAHARCIADERFDIAGEDVERHLSMSFDEPERLREAPTRSERGPLFTMDPDLSTPVGKCLPFPALSQNVLCTPFLSFAPIAFPTGN